MLLKSKLWRYPRRKIIIPGLSLPALWPPGVLAYGPPPCVCLGVISAPQSPGFSSLSHWLSSHYYSGHQHPDNPTLLTSGAHAVIREIFKHSYYSKKYLSPSANRKYLKSLEIWQYIVHNIFLCSPKIFVSVPLMLQWYDMRCEDDIVGPFSHCFTMLKWHFPPATQ